MKHLSRVVWREGMHLGPHHFQVQSRYFEDLLQFTTSSLWYAAYGLVGVGVDADVLRNGNVALTHARGVFQDGLAFHIPESDPLPEPRAIADLFPPTRESLTVLLAVPPRKADGPNCALESGQERNGLRYVAETKTLHDENTGHDEKPVQLGRKSLRLYFETEAGRLAGLLTLPVARILRDGRGNYILDPGFIPPILTIQGSERLMTIARRLVDIMEEKSKMVGQSSNPSARFRAGFSSQEVAAFWFLHTINSSLSALRHFYYSKRGHPEELFLEMSRLGGALCTFGLDSSPQAMPQYDHLHLDKCFEALDAHLRKHLELVVPSNTVIIPLSKMGRYFYEGQITDQRVLDRARWIFSIRSEVGEVELISRTPRLVKLCSSRYLPELVKTALPGLALTHLQIPPSAVAPKVDFQYFGVNRAGRCWEHIVESRGVGVYVPGELPNPEIELVVILDK